MYHHLQEHQQSPQHFTYHSQPAAPAPSPPQFIYAVPPSAPTAVPTTFTIVSVNNQPNPIRGFFPIFLAYLLLSLYVIVSAVIALNAREGGILTIIYSFVSIGVAHIVLIFVYGAHRDKTSPQEIAQFFVYGFLGGIAISILQGVVLWFTSTGFSHSSSYVVMIILMNAVMHALMSEVFKFLLAWWAFGNVSASTGTIYGIVILTVSGSIGMAMGGISIFGFFMSIAISTSESYVLWLLPVPFLMLPLQGMLGSLHGIGFAWVKQAELAPPDELVQHCRCSWTKYRKGIQFAKAYVLHFGCFMAFVYAYINGMPWLFAFPAVVLILLILNLFLNQRRLNRCSASSAGLQYPLVLMNQTQSFPVVSSETPHTQHLDSFVKSHESSV